MMQLSVPFQEELMILGYEEASKARADSFYLNWLQKVLKAFNDKFTFQLKPIFLH